MPDDLLEFVSGPPGYSAVWLWLGLSLILAVIVWYAAVFVATLPSHRLRTIPAVRNLHARVLRHRFTRTVLLSCNLMTFISCCMGAFF